MAQHAVLIGASSGIGADLARALAARGWSLSLLARREEKLQELLSSLPGTHRYRVHDVTDFAQPPALIEELEREGGPIELAVYAAGWLGPHHPDRLPVDEHLKTMRVNLLGAVAWLDPLAERMARRGAGTLVGISSVAGERGRWGQPAYCASKAGLTAWLEALRNRLAASGVRVLTVKPGPIDTEMSAGRGLPMVIPVEEHTRQLLTALDRPGVQEVFIPRRWGLITRALRALPSIVFRRLRI